MAQRHPHLITLFARTSKFGGIVNPICLAVLRLMTNSNFVGCSTGKSAGLASFENFIYVNRGAAKLLGEIRRIRHEAARFHFGFPKIVGSRFLKANSKTRAR